MTDQNTLQKLYPGGCFHIYNRGNNKETIFKEQENYTYFLKLWKKYIDPVADTFCYNLLPNHFHFFIRIRQQEQTSQVLKTCEVLSTEETSKTAGTKKPAIEQSFSNLFNAYAKAINKKYDRTGSLFQERFRRKEITDPSYYTSIIGYIITNAVKHGYSATAEAYPNSAWHSLISDKPTALLRDEIIGWFGNRETFINYIRNYENEIKTHKIHLLENEKDDWVQNLTGECKTSQ